MPQAKQKFVVTGKIHGIDDKIHNAGDIIVLSGDQLDDEGRPANELFRQRTRPYNGDVQNDDESSGDSEDAKAKAAKIVDDAKVKAAEIVKAAEEKAEKIVDDAIKATEDLAKK